MSVVEGTAAEAIEAARSVLRREASSACLLDATGLIVDVNPAWTAFAAANGGDRCTLAALLGTHYERHVEGPRPRARTEAELAQVLQGEVVQIDSECNTPDRFRLLRTHYVPVRTVGGGAVAGALVVHTVLREGPVADYHRAQVAEEATYRTGHGLLVMCSSCRRVRRVRPPDGWDYVPAWVERSPAAVSHGFCPACVMQYGYFAIDEGDDVG